MSSSSDHLSTWKRPDRLHEVWCPTCFAKPGSECVQAGFNWLDQNPARKPHQARVTSWLAVVEWIDAQEGRLPSEAYVQARQAIKEGL